MKGIYTLILLVLSNFFMTLAWYGHLQFKKWNWFQNVGIAGIVLICWGLAFFEYIFQVPANKIGFKENGGPFSLVELKMIQEVVSLIVFTLTTILLFKTDKFNWNHLAAFFCLVLAVYFVFRK